MNGLTFIRYLSAANLQNSSDHDLIGVFCCAFLKNVYPYYTTSST